MARTHLVIAPLAGLIKRLLDAVTIDRETTLTEAHRALPSPPTGGWLVVAYVTMGPPILQALGGAEFLLPTAYVGLGSDCLVIRHLSRFREKPKRLQIVHLDDVELTRVARRIGWMSLWLNIHGGSVRLSFNREWRQDGERLAKALSPA